jgi:hypothetical protein
MRMLQRATVATRGSSSPVVIGLEWIRGDYRIIGISYVKFGQCSEGLKKSDWKWEGWAGAVFLTADH